MTTKFGASILIGGLTAASLALLPFSTALAEEEEGSLQVSAEVIAVCSVTSDPLDFGFYNSSSATDALAVVNVFCTTETPGTISLGSGFNGGDGQRKMAFDSNLLAYELYNDAIRETPFGVEPATGSPGSGFDLTVYGRVPGGQTEAPVGEYTDTVLITFAY